MHTLGAHVISHGGRRSTRIRSQLLRRVNGVAALVTKNKKNGQANDLYE